ncbi:ABC transporter permease [uncultured Legionella sp.]|uniref:ABC transporter permease n=1 Tax=uncultured Legionella sp. TaxID=210934 RepID=UPI00262F7A94|nr:ABC transporter permease [uncultured Legionella sp.]
MQAFFQHIWSKQKKGRQDFQAMQAVIYTLILRNFEQNFDARSKNRRILDLLKIISEPMGHVIAWTMFRAFTTNSGAAAMSSAVFTLLGVIPWLFTYNVLHTSISCIKDNRNLLFFRQIKPCDFVIAATITELITSIFVFCVSLAIISLYDAHWEYHDPLRFICAIVVYSVFVLGCALIIACLSFFSKAAGLFVRVVLRCLYLFSGIFYSAQAIPDFYRHFFTANPLFQIIEISRECFSSFTSYPLYGDLYYLFNCAAGTLFLGLGLYILMRRSILVHIMSQ